MLSLNEARRVVRAAEKKAQQLGCAVNIAVVDETGYVVAQVRMDGAWFAGIGAAVCKAYTARAFDTATKQMMEYVRPRGELEGINRGADKRILIVAGGVPLRVNGRIAGAIGVSGWAMGDDEAIAMAGASALMNGHANGQDDRNLSSEPGIRSDQLSQIARLGKRSVSQQQYHQSIQ